MENEILLPCPFCGTMPVREVSNDILSIYCPNCVSVGFHNHVRFGCRADTERNIRTSSSKEALLNEVGLSIQYYTYADVVGD